MKIKDLSGDHNLRGTRFKHPQTGVPCIWWSQWGYEDGQAGVWYKTSLDATQVFPLFLDKLQEAGELEVVTETQPTKTKTGWTKLEEGCYEHADGFMVERIAAAPPGFPKAGWYVFKNGNDQPLSGPFGTLREAKARV